MALKPVRKAVFPVGGLGTRFLPATKAMPKEMLPVVDKPLIQYAVEEAQAAGIDRQGELASALNDPAVKQRLREEVSQAISKGVFGSPLFVVDGEPFWGHDRLDQVDLWLQRGGW